MDSLRKSVERQWYGSPHWLLLLLPLTWLFAFLSRRRRRKQLFQQQKLPLPVVVVGNIAVGGTGKTPFIVALAKALIAQGRRPGIVARGYGGKLDSNLILNDDTTAQVAGDEPVFLYQTLKCPVAVGRKRVKSVELLAQNTPCDIVLSDDGLQHYRMARDLEVVMIDAERGLGNGFLLPVGPLRESAERLHHVDWVVINGGATKPVNALKTKSVNMELSPVAWRNVHSGELCSIEELPLANAAAIAGIGNPQRFFNTLQTLGFVGECQPFADHHAYSAADLAKFKGKKLLMTEKDAVKCQAFAQEDWWALVVEFKLPQELVDEVNSLVHERH